MKSTKNSTRTLTVLALLIAMSIVFSRVLSISTGFVRFNLGSLPVLLAGIVMGTLFVAVVGTGAGLALDFIHRPEVGDPRPYAHLSTRAGDQLNFLSVEEGHFEGDKWVVDYIRNGDESNFCLYSHEGQVVRIRLNPNTGMDLN